MTPNPTSVAQRNERVYSWIKEFVDEHDYPPTMRQIAEGCGYSSSSSAHNAVWALIAEGRLSGSPGRTLRISGQPQAADS